MGRIPKQLQQVFLDSNREIEPVEPPKDGSAFRVFRNFRNRFSFAMKKTDCTVEVTTSASEVNLDEDKTREVENQGQNQVKRKSRISKVLRRSLGSSEHSRALITSEHSRAPKPPSGNISPPQQLVERCMESLGMPYKRYSVLKTAHNRVPTPYQLACFESQLISSLIDKQDESGLVDFLACGMSPNGCNKQGDSLLKSACHKGYITLVKVFDKFGACFTQSDPQGRTLLHFTCMGDYSDDRFATFDLIVRKHPHLLCMEDDRGACPLEYVDSSQYSEWNSHLKAIKDTVHFYDFALLDLISDGPHSHPIPDPENRLSAMKASMIASGCVSASIAKGTPSRAGQDSSDYDSVCSVESSSFSTADLALVRVEHHVNAIRARQARRFEKFAEKVGSKNGSQHDDAVDQIQASPTGHVAGFCAISPRFTSRWSQSMDSSHDDDESSCFSDSSFADDLCLLNETIAIISKSKQAN